MASVNPYDKGPALKPVMGISGFLFFTLSAIPQLTSNTIVKAKRGHWLQDH